MTIVADLIDAIVKNDEAFKQTWISFSLIVELRPDGSPEGTNGYLYTDDDYEAIAVRPRLLREVVAAYLRTVYGDGRGPIKMLIQFDRASGRFNVEFEDKNPKQWSVTPSGIHGYIASLRPKFDQ